MNQDRCFLAAPSGAPPAELLLEAEAYATEDVESEPNFLAGVSDGVSMAVGGHLAARCVAGCAVTFGRERLKQSPLERSELLTDLFDSANAELGRVVAAMALQAESAQLVSHAGAPAATLAALLVGAGDARVAVVGDSRVYLLRNGILDQLSVDGDLLSAYLRQGLSPREARERDDHAQLASWVGTFEAEERAGGRYILPDRPRLLSQGPDFRVYAFAPRPGDVLCCCSDGVSDYVDSGELDLREALSAPSPAEACRRIVQTANACGGHDNISVVVSRLDPEAEEERHPCPAR